MRRMNDNFIFTVRATKLLFVDLCRDCEANVPCCGVYTAQRLPGLWILPATHATLQAHGTCFPFTAHSQMKTNLRWKLVAVQRSCAESWSECRWLFLLPYCTFKHFISSKGDKARASRFGDEMLGWVSRKFGDVWHCLSSPSQIILESWFDNDYKRHHGSHVTNAAISEFRWPP